MWKNTTAIFLFLAQLLMVHSAFSEGGTVRDDLSIESKLLGKPVSYGIYLPEDYHTSARSYPVLYLLHGFTDDHSAWIQFGELKNIADREIQKESVTPMIIVTPDAGVSWYVDSHDGKVPYEQFFIEEFIPAIESTYRIKSRKQFRAIAGLSMGGHGTLIYAIKHPDLFSVAAPLSGSMRIDEDLAGISDADWNRMFTVPFGQRHGNDRITDHLKNNTVLHLVESTPAESLRKVRYYIDCGDDDTHLIGGNMKLHSMLMEKGVPHEFRVRDGGHNWEYWRSALPDVLAFTSRYFHR